MSEKQRFISGFHHNFIYSLCLKAELLDLKKNVFENIKIDTSFNPAVSCHTKMGHVLEVYLHNYYNNTYITVSMKFGIDSY